MITFTHTHAHTTHSYMCTSIAYASMSIRTQISIHIMLTHAFTHMHTHAYIYMSPFMHTHSRVLIYLPTSTHITHASVYPSVHMSTPEHTCPTHTYTCTNISLHLTHTNIAHHVITCTCTPMDVQAHVCSVQTWKLSVYPRSGRAGLHGGSVSDLWRNFHAGVYHGTGPLQ